MISARFRRVNPSAHFYLGAVGETAFSNLQEILKIAILIKASQGEQPAYARAAFMNAAAPFRVQIKASFLRTRHHQIRQNDAVHYIQRHCAFREQLRQTFPQSPPEPVHIIGIQHHRIAHSRTAPETSRTAAAICLYHIIAIV